MIAQKATNWEIEKLLLETKVFDGARALDDYFRSLEFTDGCDPIQYAETVADKYLLTGSQRKFLSETAVRAQRARGIVKYFENRFGLEGQLIRDPEGLYRSIFVNTRAPKIKAYSNRIGIGFERGKWTEKGTMGYVKEFYFDQLGVPLEQTIERLEKGQRTNCGMITYTYPSIATYLQKLKTKEWNPPAGVYISGKQSKDEKISHAFMLQQDVQAHEMRHIIDNIIIAHGAEKLAGEPIFVETQACIFGDHTLSGMRRDFKIEETAKSSLEYHVSRMPSLLKPGTPPEMIEAEKSIIQDCKKHVKNIGELKNAIYEVIEKIRCQNHNHSFYKALSYIFSTLPPEKVPKYLGIIASGAHA